MRFALLAVVLPGLSMAAEIPQGAHVLLRMENSINTGTAQEGDFVRLGLALEQHEGGIATEQRAALARQSLAQARRDRADA